MLAFLTLSVIFRHTTIVEVEKLPESKIYFNKVVKTHPNEELKNHPRLKKKKLYDPTTVK